MVVMSSIVHGVSANTLGCKLAERELLWRPKVDSTLENIKLGEII